jgi:hypothetical protein
MSGKKNVLKPIPIATAQPLASSFNSAATMIPYLDNCAYQINVTTTNSTGTFSVQGSLDFNQATFDQLGTAGNWADLTLGGITPAPVAAGVNDTIIINLNQVPFNALRISYTSSVAGTGHADIIFMSKML